MRLKKYLIEKLQHISDTGKRGKQFENYFKEALDMVGLNYISNSSSGSIWDIKSIGDQWKKIVNKTNINIKLSSTKWLFGSTYLSNILPWNEELPEDFNKDKYKKMVKEFFNNIGVPSTVFLKPKNSDIEKKIIDAVKNEDTEELQKLFIKKNFKAEKLTKSYNVRILTKKNKITSVVIDKGDRVFMRSEKPRKMGGSYMVTFKSPTIKLGKTNRSLKKE